MGQLDVGGLYQKFGLEQTTSQAGGEYKTYAELREIEIDLDLTTLTTTPTIITGVDNIVFPAGVRIEEVVIVNKVAATGSGSTLDLGLVRNTDRTTEIDFDGILAVAPRTDWASLGQRTTYTATTPTGFGALMTAGTTGAIPGHLTANYKTAAFTAGIVTIRIKYRKP